MLEDKYPGFEAVRFLRRVGDLLRHPSKATRRLARRARRMFAAAALKQRASGTLGSGVFRLSVVEEAETDGGWKPYPKFAGSTAVAESFSCHSSALAPGHCPHPPHEHRDEEILMMLSGEAQLVLPSQREGGGSATITLRAGQFVYYPAGFRHTLRASREAPANYLMFKWFSTIAERENALGYLRRDVAEGFVRIAAGTGFRSQLLFEGATRNLAKLRCHVSTLTPGAGYKPHADPYDVAIVVLGGCIETLGRQAKPPDVVFYTAGASHGMRNPADTIARYVVFEFHR